VIETDTKDTTLQGTAPGNRPLPDGWHWVRLGHVCTINPPRPRLERDDDAPTTFVPMPAVAEAGRGIVAPEKRPFASIRKGYTFFVEGDVLFAKISPCMQNGKHAVARNLLDGIGFGSTEFHVLRACSEVLPEWIHQFIIQPWVLDGAVAHFSGAVGQQRVPELYLANLMLPLPPLAEQQRIAAILTEQMAVVERARSAAKAQLEAARELPAAYLRTIFEGAEARQWPEKRLGDVLQLRKNVVHPKDNPRGAATFVGLEHVASLTGLRTGAVDVEMSQLTGRKPKFYKGDIVYGYLRPYLNKVWVAEFDGLCSVDQYVYRVPPDKADTEFVAWFMRSDAYLTRAPIDTTPGQLPRIRTEEVASVPINLPPLDEQRRVVAMIAERMAAVEQMSTNLDAQLKTVNGLPAALLQKAFSGQL